MLTYAEKRRNPTRQKKHALIITRWKWLYFSAWRSARKERIWWHHDSAGREMFLNPWYSGQQQQNSSNPPPGTSVVSNPEQNGVVNNGGVGSVVANINHVGRSPAPSPRLLPRSLDNRNHQQSLEDVQRRLRSGWTVHMNSDGRFYYCK